MKHVFLSIANAKLSKLLNRAISGEDVTITIDGKPFARIVAISAPKEILDLETMRAHTSKMKPYPGSFVEDMRAAGEL